MGRLETLWVWYGWTIAALLLVAGRDVPHRWLWCAGHVAVVGPAVLLSRAPDLVRYAAACILVPAAFSTLGVLIPELVPEPFHWHAARWDAAIGGGAVAALGRDPARWLVEICQLCYSTFYLLPLALGAVLAKRRNWSALSDCAVLIAGGFLLSYMGYVLMPTLPPYRFVDYPSPLAGGPAFDALNPLLYELEALRQDCMPSGHTMMTLLVCRVAWKYARVHLRWLGPIASFLILGTIVLRYHWFVDLVMALPFLGAAVWLFEQPRVSRAVAPTRR